MPVLGFPLDGALDLHPDNCSKWGLSCFWDPGWAIKCITFVLGHWPSCAFCSDCPCVRHHPIKDDSTAPSATRWCATPQLEREGLVIQLNKRPWHAVGSVTHISKFSAVCNCKQDSRVPILCMQTAIRNLELLQTWVQKIVRQTN